MTTDTLRHDTYNVSRGRPYTNREFAGALEAVIPGVRLGLKAGGRPGPYLDISRLAADTGFAPAFDVPAAVADYVAWRAGNPR
jgi:nucleoside-diphosphate-sugar epimerase